LKQFLYHVTPQENVASIKQRGLVRGGLKRIGFAVSCSVNPEDWWMPGLAIFKVRITGLKCKMTTFLPESDEVLIWGDVPPERLSLCETHEVIRKKVIKERSRWAQQ
jgi:hypothetical protein